MKFALITLSIATLLIGSSLQAFGQDHAASLPENNYDAQRTGLGTTSKSASGASAEATPNPEESNTDENDDSLYRGKTSEVLGDGVSQEGPLHFKSKPKERIQKVDSLKSLQTSGTDPKFQGSFITSGVSSIDKVAEKANPAPEVEPQAEQEVDSRFVKRHLKFTPDAEDKSAKPAAADSGPSATPTPTASPAKKKSSDDN